MYLPWESHAFLRMGRLDRSYYGLTEHRREITLALCFAELEFVGEPRFGTNGPLLPGPARPEWYHGLTENRRETTLALRFAEWVRLPEAQTP